MMDRIILATFAVALLSAILIAQSPTPEKEPVKANSRPSPTPTAAVGEPFDKADVSTMAGKCVTLETESGSIVIEMYPESAPETVRNFLNLTAIGAFDTTMFTRVVPGFVIQGGNLYARDGKITNELGLRARRTVVDEPNKILHERGIVSMARTEEPNSATTNFFILVGPAPHLDGKFSAFGKVRSGMDVVDSINKAPVTDERPEKPVKIKKASVAACPADQTSKSRSSVILNSFAIDGWPWAIATSMPLR